MACFSMQCSAPPHKEEKLKFSAALWCPDVIKKGGQVGIIQGEGLDISALCFPFPHTSVSSILSLFASHYCLFSFRITVA